MNCLVVVKDSFPLAGLPAPSGPVKEVLVFGSAKAGGRTYRFEFFGVAPVESKVYTVSGFRVGTTSTGGSCGAGFLGYTSSVGVALVP